MNKTIQIERRKRGFFGWVFLILFLGFNLLMAIGVFGAIGDAGNQMNALASDSERAGYAAGTAIGVSFLVIVWAAGAVILGLLAMLTRGGKVVVERTTT